MHECGISLLLNILKLFERHLIRTQEIVTHNQAELGDALMISGHRQHT